MNARPAAVAAAAVASCTQCATFCCTMPDVYNKINNKTRRATGHIKIDICNLLQFFHRFV